MIELSTHKEMECYLDLEIKGVRKWIIWREKYIKLLKEKFEDLNRARAKNRSHNYRWVMVLKVL